MTLTEDLQPGSVYWNPSKKMSVVKVVRVDSISDDPDCAAVSVKDMSSGKSRVLIVSKDETWKPV